ncbi:MAG: Mitochondrial-processing peptidase subunit alpha [Trizodia sp. TS-e1964]|nr:MAG: Mitochondrial-processing peptidase subunit alpha [Trizodia sp. TS-e1964]
MLRLASRRARFRLPRSSTKSITPALTLPSRRFATLVDAIQKDPAELDEISTLPNGLRVATEALPGHFSGIGVYIDSGSRFENDKLQGVSHIIDRLAFKSTKSRTSDQMLESLETLGGNIQCASSRESLMYQSATFNSSVPTTLALLAETIREPLITEEEVQQQLQTADYEIKEIWSKPELILPELVHIAAYKGNTLGNPLLCPKERLSEINKGVVEAYRDTFYKPERIVVAFAGVQHEEAVALTKRYFGDMKRGEGPRAGLIDSETSSAAISPIDSDPTYTPSSSSSSQTSTTSWNTSLSAASQPPKLISKIPFIKSLSTSAPNHANILSDISTFPSPLDLKKSAHYTGGFLSLPSLPPPLNPALPSLTHIHLAFEALPISSDDIYALATLQTLLGGGGSFSAGGPGKGMYSRLYTNVLNQHAWVESCVAFNHSYTDSGLFGISATCTPGKVSQMLEVMCRELKALTLDHGFPSLQIDEVNRAKNQLRSALLMNLESRMVELEDLGRQVQVHGRKVGVREMCRNIEALTVADIRRVATTVLSGQVINLGNGSGAPTVVLQEGEERGSKLREFEWNEIQDRIARWQLGRS